MEMYCLFKFERFEVKPRNITLSSDLQNPINKEIREDLRYEL